MPISRRRFLESALTASAAGALLHATPAQGEVQTNANGPTGNLLVLENEWLHLTLDAATGCVAQIATKDGRWKLEGAGLRLHVPAPEHRYHYLTERNAGRPRIDLQGQQATVIWAAFHSDRLGKLDIEIKERIRLEGAGVRFSYELRNGSSATIESYTYPRFTGLRPVTGERTLRQGVWNYGHLATSSLWPRFGNEVGYYGSDTPAQMHFLGTDKSFCLVLGESGGIYIGYHDKTQAQAVQLRFSLTPAYSDSYNSYTIDAAGKTADPSISIDPNHLCFVGPGEAQHSEELVFEPFQGTWHKGADIYKQWRATWYKRPITPQWAREVHAWQQIQINSSEDRLEFPYKDLIRYARACQRWGVKAIQLTGWQTGGQDRNFPLHDIDPRLGTAEEFKAAIAESRKMGVEIVLFNKYAWADVTGPAYQNDFKRFAVEDPYGNPYMFNGYEYDTPTQLAGINTRRGVGMCQASPLWRKRALEEFRKSVDLGAGGILFDECQWHMSPYCFSKNHGHRVPGAVFSGDVALIEGFRALVDPEKFIFAGESPYDVELQTYNLSYFRIENGFIPVGRYIDPDAPMSVAVTGFDDRAMINACLLYRFAMSYEPRDFHGELDEMPETMRYGQAMDHFRRRYAQWVWDAEFRDTLGATVTVDGKPHRDYAVFVRADGRRAVAIANMSDTARIECELKLEDGGHELKVVSPEAPEPSSWPGKLELAPGFAAVVFEA